MKTYAHRFAAAVALAVAGWTLTGCVGREPRYVIGVSQCSDDIWRDKLNAELLTATYLHDGVALTLASAGDDDRQQVEQIDRFLDEGIDLLIVAPNQVSTITPAIDRAYDRGVPVIVFDRRTDSEKYTARIGADNRELGRLVARYVVARLSARGKVPEGGWHVLEVMGLEGSSPAIERHEGFSEVLAAQPDIHLVASLQGDWTEQSAVRATRAWAEAHPDEARRLDYVFGQNDRMAVGVRQALAGLSPEAGAYACPSEAGPRYVGIDGLPGEGGGIDCVSRGVLEASCIYPTHGDEVLQLALDILEGRPYEREGALPTAIVTADNAHVLQLEHDELERQGRNLETLHERVTDLRSVISTRTTMMLLLAVLLVAVAGLAAYAWRAYIVGRMLSERLRTASRRQHRLAAQVSEMSQSQAAFFTNVSHELRTPLTLVADPVEQLRRDPLTPQAQRPLLDMMARPSASCARSSTSCSTSARPTPGACSSPASAST